MRNKIFLITISAIVLVGISFFIFNEREEIFSSPPQEEIPPEKKEIAVYVSGQVKTPSVVTFDDSEELKIIDAVNAAGGLTESADTEFINLSDDLTDGQHIHIPAKEISMPEKNSPIAEKNSSSGLININTADEKDLQKIRGVGPAIAQRIIDFREQNGKFKSIDEIKKVRGIGEKTFEKIKDSITVN